MQTEVLQQVKRQTAPARFANNYAILSSRTANEQAFALQYTSVIIIVLAFVVGSFVKPFLPELPTELPVKLVNKEVGNLKFENIFKINSSSVNDSIVASLVTFAKSHDLNLEIQVYADANWPTKISPEQISIARSIELYRYLINQGLHPDSIKVFAQSKLNTIQAEVMVRYDYQEEL